MWPDASPSVTAKNCWQKFRKWIYVIGTGEVGRIVKHLQSLNTTKPRRAAVMSKPDFLMTAQHERLLSSTSATAYLKISDGCSNCCAYCAIPSIRGSARSRQPDDILREAQKLAARGIKEIILIGQDTTAYGRDLKNRPKLSDLLSDLASVSGVRWLRLLYTHPAHITTDILEAMADHEKICRYIDLPIQHIDDTLLTAMNRKVSADQNMRNHQSGTKHPARCSTPNVDYRWFSRRNVKAV
ncbi:MAG: radical SAM protein [Desulfobacterales bacterium]|nr:radical SAM protein [Desulfobacterales bacterium]